MKSLTAAFIYLMLIIGGCEFKDTNSIKPSSLSDESEENHTVYSFENEIQNLKFERDKSFGETEDVFFSAMGDFTVDDSGRVYILDQGWGTRSLHVFNKDGSYLNKIAGEGRGPAEFLSATNFEYKNGKLIFFDSDQSRISLYEGAPLTYSKNIIVNPANWQYIEELTGRNPISFNILSNNSFLAGFVLPTIPANAEKSSVKFYKIDNEFEFISDKIFEFKTQKHVWSSRERGKENVRVRLLKRFPFFDQSLIAISEDDHIFHARTNEFTIEEYDENGDFIKSFSYPLETKSVTRDDALRYTNETTRDIGMKVDLPEKWPSLYQMFIDDEGRLWVSGFSDVKGYLNWFVLERSGKLLYRFKWPGEMTSYPNSPSNKILVKDGYLYKMEINKKSKAEELIRYKFYNSQ